MGRTATPSKIKYRTKKDDYARKKQEKNIKKMKRRLKLREEEEKDPEKKKARLKKNVPKTLDNTREVDETIIGVDDDEVFEEEVSDEFSKYFQDGLSPKMLITTNKVTSKSSYRFASELVDVFPNSQYVRRNKKFTIGQIIEFCKNREFTDLLFINEDKKSPYSMTLIHLPNGPTAYFRLTNVKLSHEIYGHGRSSNHKPELILNNFNTRLGHTIGRWFQALFPHVPQFQGRQVATFHNQRDFIFFRRHR
ncbi:11379_t:CDS:2 [Entrophospora sp. SA101]|nr:11379_t:CDS:2 [Entrophospora sp. SA101]CAJ0858212.1 1984_t:CDS:2 [Entrophospora sp. SA101]